MQGSSVEVGDFGMGVSSGDGDALGVSVGVDDASGALTCGVGVKKGTLTPVVGVAFLPEGAIKGVGVLVGAQAANRQQNTQY